MTRVEKRWIYILLIYLYNCKISFKRDWGLMVSVEHSKQIKASNVVETLKKRFKGFRVHV